MTDEQRKAHQAGLIRGLSRHFGAPVEIFDFKYLFGGGSRILARFTARVSATDGVSNHALVFRLDPPSSFVESDRAIEFKALEVLHDNAAPVPRPILLDAAGDLLGASCFIMSEIPSGAASQFFDVDPYQERRAEVGRQVFTALGAIAAIDVEQSGLNIALPNPGPNPAESQLDYWEGMLNNDETSPQPIVRAGIRALRRRLPSAPAKLALVHGDFRSGNFLIDEASQLIAILDWEFVHLGDPLEDIAWCADPLWGHADPSRVGGMLPLDAAIAAWESTSGRTVDHKRLDWWRLFSAVKGMAMWTSSTEEFLRVGGGAPGMALPDLICANVQERVIAETLWRWEDAL